MNSKITPQTMILSRAWRIQGGLNHKEGYIMPKGMRQRKKDGPFRTHLRWPGIDGTLDISLHTTDPVLAKARLDDIRAQLRAGVDPRRQLQLFEKASEKYLGTVTKQKVEKSQYMDRSRFKNHLLPYFGGKRIGHIASDESCILYKVHRETQGAARETIEKELWLFKGAINIALPDWKLLSLKSKKYGKWLKPKMEIVRFLTEDQWWKILGICDEEAQDLVILARYTGLRLGDCVGLKWSSVDFSRKQVVVSPGKTSAEAITVTIPIMGPLMDVLNRLKKFRRLGDDRVFIVEPNEQAFKRRIQRGFKSACIGAGLPEFRFHDLRHDFCSQLIQNNGGDIYPVADLAGHKNIATTRKYAHLSDNNRLHSMEMAFKKVGQKG